MSMESRDILDRRVKLIGAVITILGVAIGVYQFTRTQAVEAAKPYLEHKLKWCEEAAETAAFIAVHGKEAGPAKLDRFWELYWGVMGMVENDEITTAMVEFGEGLSNQSAENKRANGSRALKIARACRTEMANEWSPAWKWSPAWRR